MKANDEEKVDHQSRFEFEDGISVDELADKLLMDVKDGKGWESFEFEDGLLTVKEITKEQKQKNREDWR